MRCVLVLVALVACKKPHPVHPDEDEDSEGDESAHRYASEDQAVADGAMAIGDAGVAAYHCIELPAGPPRVMVGDVTRTRVAGGRNVIDVAIGLESGLCPDWSACLTDDSEHCLPDGALTMVSIAKARSTYAVAPPHESQPHQRIRVEQPKAPPAAVPDVIDAHIVRVEVVGSYQMVFIDRGLSDGITAQWQACLVSRDDRCLDVPVTLVGVDARQSGVRVDVSLTDLNVKPIVRLRRR